jgi:hypothetical protein
VIPSRLSRSRPALERTSFGQAGKPEDVQLRRTVLDGYALHGGQQPGCDRPRAKADQLLESTGEIQISTVVFIQTDGALGRVLNYRSYCKSLTLQSSKPQRELSREKKDKGPHIHAATILVHEGGG